ncbi:peptide chain release factor N(5)-glutamine methyltransferase [Candidatus Nitrospira bockiana]
MTLATLLIDAARALSFAGVPCARREARWIIEYGLGRDALFLHLHRHEAVPAPDLERVWALVQRRASREPLQYLLGSQEFCGFDFKVGPDVLIPRPETELLVEAVQEHCPPGRRSIVVELGTGSGCIAVALSSRRPDIDVYATDISLAALAIARRNAETHRVQHRVRFLHGDLFEALIGTEIKGRVSALVSNPPYIPESDLALLQEEVRFEPPLALCGGPDGLSFFRRILEEAAVWLDGDGLLALEVGQGQAGSVSVLARDKGNYYNIRTARDVQGIERVVIAQKKP